NLLKGNKEVFNIFTSKLSDISESPNYDWLIPSNINNTDVTNGGDDYKIKVVVFDYTTGQTQALDYSDNFFSIIGNSSSSSSSSSPSTSGTLTAITGGLDHLSADATVLNGTVINPNKENVSYYFHYSKDDPSSAQVIETNWTSINYSSLQNVSAYISGLSSGTKYVYRLYAYSHTTGKVVSGELKYFTTLSSSSSSSVNYSYITVINPNGGQVIKNANTVISWSITPFSSKNFGINLLYDNDDLAANIRTCNSLSLTNTDGTYHFYNWKAGFDANNQEIPNGKYKILVYDCAGGTVSGYGNSFDLISLSSSSSSSSLTSNNTNTYRQTSNYTSSSSQEISLSQLVELFIALGIISPDKANFARASVKAAR
ncbi:hypothetical protein KGQ29_00360, partial [Patescibacteria group bacterium]|nr:hypothetical protein [Patescibacteria group bacterium]